MIMQNDDHRLAKKAVELNKDNEPASMYCALYEEPVEEGKRCPAPLLAASGSVLACLKKASGTGAKLPRLPLAEDLCLISNPDLVMAAAALAKDLNLQNKVCSKCGMENKSAS